MSIWTYLLMIVIYFVVWYVITLIFKNAGLIDIGWGFGFVIVAWFAFASHARLGGAVLTAMVTLWGLRLTYHVFRRNVGKPEDYRYANFRAEWGKWFNLRAFFQLFMFQAFAMWVIALAYILGIKQPAVQSSVTLVIGVAIWLIGFLFEAIGDDQLKRFVADPTNKGKLIETGLWRYTRHPNYFGEALSWWGVYLAALACGAPWWTVVSPLLITTLIRFVSGVPMLEKRNRRKEGYAAYSQRVSVFIPWFRKEASDEK